MSVRWDEKRQRFTVDYYKHIINEEGKRIRIRPRMNLPAYITDIGIARAIEADLTKNDMESSMNNGGFSSVEELLSIYLQDRKEFMTESTWKNIEWTFKNHISKHLGKFRISEIGKEHTKIYQRLRKSTGVCGRTVNKEMGYFMGFLKWCRSEYKINIPDFKYERLPHVKKPILTLTLQEVIKLILATETKYTVLFSTLFLLGLRFSEATHLEWTDIDWSNRTIRIIGKGGTEKLLPVPDWWLRWVELLKPVKTAVEAELEKGNNQKLKGLVFRSKRTGGVIVNVKKSLKNACIEAGIEKHVYPHLLRHTLATQLGGLNINMKQIQLLLRHAQESTTADLYTHLIVDHLRPAQDVLVDAMKNAISHRNEKKSDY